MHRAAGQRGIRRSEYDALVADLARAEDRLRAALEDAAEDMRGWSDIAEKAAFAASIEPLSWHVAMVKSSLATVFPVDDQQFKQQEFDEFTARLKANADVFRLEVWDGGQFVREVPWEAGPCDPQAISTQIRATGVVGELRLIKGERGSPRERCLSVYPLSGRQVHQVASHPPDEATGARSVAGPSCEATGEGMLSYQPQSPRNNELGAVVEIGDVDDYFDGQRRRFCLRTRKAIRRGAALIAEPSSGRVIRAVSSPFPFGTVRAASSQQVCAPIFEEFLVTLSRDGWERLPAKGSWWYSVRLIRTSTR